MPRAAILREAGKPLEMGTVDLADLRDDQVRVRVTATGVCHSDLSLARGGLAQRVPAVLGHEGTGVVVAAGPSVTSVAVGDTVILCWAPACGACFFCARGEPYLCERAADDVPYGTVGGERAYPGLGVGSFAEETVLPERAVVPVSPSVPRDVAAIVGCAVMTGFGAVVNTARVPAGATVAVLGCGGVGLAAIQAARYAGAALVVAVDVTTAKRDLALDLGATHAVDGTGDVVAAVRDLTEGRGVDYAFEAIGRAATIRTAYTLTRRGGTTVVVGVGRRDDPVTFSALELFHQARTLVGCVYGSADVTRDLARILDLYASGALALDRLVTRHVRLEDVNDAFARMEAGEGARSVIRFD